MEDSFEANFDQSECILTGALRNETNLCKIELVFFPVTGAGR